MSQSIHLDDNSFIEKTCRACCRYDPNSSMTLHPIFNGGDTGEPSAEFINVFEEFILWNLKIERNDGLPQQMCTDCLDRFVQVNIFRQEVVDSQSLLLTYINEGMMVKDRGSVTLTTVTIEPVPNVAIEKEEYEDYVGYDSPNKLIEYVGSEEEAEFLDSNQIDDALEIDNFEENESDFLFNHPNEIQTNQNNSHIKVVNDQKPKDLTTTPDCSKKIEEKSTSPLAKKERRKRNEMLELNAGKNEAVRCDICMKFFPSISKLKRHTREFHRRRDYVCPVCGEKMQQITARNYYYHMYSHRDKKYKCSYCEKAFVQRVHLINHERIHTKEKPFECDHCGKKYAQLISLQDHRVLHTDSRPWKCEICGKALKRRSCLIAHMRCHGDGFHCEMCGLRYNQKAKLDLHMLSHTGKNPYECKFCSKTFRQSFQLGNHLHSYHLGESNENGMFRCLKCDEEFDNALDLIKHRNSHDTSERPFVCDQCGSGFKKKSHLTAHVNGVHLKKRAFACMYCNKGFTDVTNLNIHMKIHTGEASKQHNCNECNKCFATKNSLTLHKYSHSKEKRFKCTFCEESFRFRQTLGLHVLKHFRDDNEGEENNVKEEVPNEEHFENYEEDLDLTDDYKLLDSVDTVLEKYSD